MMILSGCSVVDKIKYGPSISRSDAEAALKTMKGTALPSSTSSDSNSEGTRVLIAKDYKITECYTESGISKSGYTYNWGSPSFSEPDFVN